MENRLTKKRLANYLSYEWLGIVATVVAAVFLIIILYNAVAVKLTVGQHFKYYFDENINADSVNSVTYLITKGKGGNTVLSYDVLSFTEETLVSGNNVLSTRIQIQEGDVCFTDVNSSATSKRACTIIDVGYVYSYDKLFSDGKKYLAIFLADPSKSETEDMLDYNNLDEGKIKAHFRERMKNDNRFRTEEQKLAGEQQEIERIKTVCKDLTDLKILLEYDDELRQGGDSLFYDYIYYEQTYQNTHSQEAQTRYESAKQSNIDLYGRERLRYALKLEKLEGGEGKKTVNEYFRLKDRATSKDVVLITFDFWSYQYDLQFETVTFVNTIVRDFSTILDD